MIGDELAVLSRYLRPVQLRELIVVFHPSHKRQLALLWNEVLRRSSISPTRCRDRKPEEHIDEIRKLYWSREVDCCNICEASTAKRCLEAPWEQWALFVCDECRGALHVMSKEERRQKTDMIDQIEQLAAVPRTLLTAKWLRSFVERCRESAFLTEFMLWTPSSDPLLKLHAEVQSRLAATSSPEDAGLMWIRGIFGATVAQKLAVDLRGGDAEEHMVSSDVLDLLYRDPPKPKKSMGDSTVIPAAYPLLGFVVSRASNPWATELGSVVEKSVEISAKRRKLNIALVITEDLTSRPAIRGSLGAELSRAVPAHAADPTKAIRTEDPQPVLAAHSRVSAGDRAAPPQEESQTVEECLRDLEAVLANLRAS